MYVNVYFIMYIEEQYAVSDKIEVLLLAYLDGLYRSILNSINIFVKITLSILMYKNYRSTQDTSI